MPKSKVQRRRLALLGATGRTGHQILQKLLQEPIVGSISTSILNDKTLIRECLAQVDTIICIIGENENIPGVTVLQDSARVTLTALSSLKTPTTKTKTPSRLLLSSGTWNLRFAATRPVLLDWMIRNALQRPNQSAENAPRCTLTCPCPMRIWRMGFVQLVIGRFADDTVGVGVSSQKAKRPVLYVPFVLGKVFRGLLFRFVPGYWKAEYAVSGFVGRWQKPKN
ncbi:uncharacterized protein ASPGLDRAFT_56018 [Aspergillus glaucus CBS 516.65]|uniref:NAD(P)-binding domain-containing protein n=1 Tax=Aspergillus glaucus CBS 516.65 TaxID=1160497 RepID=A0A1L9VR52_ASPGL|nr:hypothetical protein ASPGLDRAFT_56018 [Aspergillus glaucus CBS 516.65]OJJ86405.1 hypothetical protein ASPGLDRAFT_56018 [Aspergillus glaucus CBS 516.65]